MEHNINQLEDGQKRLENKVDTLEEGQNRLEGRLERVESRLEKVEGRLEKVEDRLEKVEGRLEKVEGDISFLRDEVRIGFNELKSTLNSMFDLTAKSIRANKKVAVIMENAYSEASEEYTKIKTRSKR